MPSLRVCTHLGVRDRDSRRRVFLSRRSVFLVVPLTKLSARYSQQPVAQKHRPSTHTIFRHHPKQTPFDPPQQELSIDAGLTSLAPKTSELFLFKHTTIPSSTPLRSLHYGLATRNLPASPRPRVPALPAPPVRYGRALVSYRQIL
jgi:hypothetical protein